MPAIDTNVVARFLLDDDPIQSPIARDTIEAGVFVPHTVLVELVWLLASRYRQPHHVIVVALRDIIDIPSVEVIDRALIHWAIDRYEKGADFADMIHIAASRDQGSFVSFEKRLTRLAGPEAPVQIETLS